MVGHQNVSVKAKTVALPIMLDALEISGAVPVILKSPLPLIAAHNHVIERTVKLNSGLACHVPKLPTTTPISQYSGLTPNPGASKRRSYERARQLSGPVFDDFGDIR